MYHKSCVLGNKGKFKLLNGPTIMCCEKQKPKEMALLEAERSIPEKTVEVMKEENDLKNKHMVQMRLESHKFVEDAIKNEEELKEIITIRDKEISKANKKIEELETKLRLTHKDITHSETQTTPNITRSVAVQVIQKSSKHKISSVQTELTEGDITDLETKKKILENEAENLEYDMRKLENDIRELTILNNNMITSIEVLTVENDMYRRELQDWKNN
ncbi:hypothetical protein JTB14_008313 [Gonioctena quinquepunctata]|nr:hypothetical protein JTB14_008313 [Gonioctena quinquepunctata]